VLTKGAPRSGAKGFGSMNGTQERGISDRSLSPAVKRLWETFYPRYRSHDFEQYVASLVQPSMQVLEIGAGSGTGLQNTFALKGRCRLYAGVDLDPHVLNNPFLDRAYVASAADLPFEDESFDLVFHKMVAEHFNEPAMALAETARVLKPGGQLLFETPNRLYYPMVIARWTPTSFHRFFVRRFASGRSEHEVFPTYYRLNDRRTIRRLCGTFGLKADISLRSTPPGYLRFSVATFLIGILYERTAERFVPSLRGLIWVDARRLDDGAAADQV
jgi:SAM-dependent methyltransferase